MRRLLWLALLSAVIIPVLSAAPLRQKTVKNVKFCHLGDLMTGNKFHTTVSGRNFTADARGFSCVFTHGQRRFSCNNTKIELLHNPPEENGQFWISNLDWFKTLRPLLYPATVPRQRVTAIMIDMGHGGKDPGALGKYSKEKMITLKVGLRVAQILKSYGFKVNMTRTSDIYIPLDQIGPMQKRSGSDLFVSIHVNSAASRSVSGIETYCLTPAGAASSNGGKISFDTLPGNRQDPANFLLAWNIQNSLLKRTGAADRGIKRARFAVLKELTAPGVLVEIGFITNAAEEKKLNSTEYIDKIAHGIVDGIVLFTRITKPR